MGAPTVQEAIERALADARQDYDAAGVIVVTSFEATHAIDASEPALREAIYTIFRGLPARIAPGASLFIGTVDRAGGDVELVWEARERVGVGDPGARGVRETLRAGPYGDLYELAMLGLESICRARAGYIERESPSGKGNVTSVVATTMRDQVIRRFSFVFAGPHDRYPGAER